MKLPKINSNVIMVALLLLLLGAVTFTTSKWMAAEKDADRWLETVISDGKFYETKIKGKDQVIYSQKQTIVSSQKEIEKLLGKNKSFANIKAQVSFKGKTAIENIDMPIQNAVYKKDTVDGNTYLKVPANVSYFGNRWFNFVGKITTNGTIHLDSAYVFDDFKVTLGDSARTLKDKLLFRKPKPLVTIENQNPYFKINEMSNVVIKDNRKRKVTLGGQLGFGAAYYDKKIILAPYAGFGINF